MTWIKKLLSFDKRLAGSFIAATLLAIAFFLLGVFYDKQPRLRCTLLSQAPVYDVHEDVPDLDIIFRSKSIRQEHQTLSVLTVRIENSGSAGLTIQSFDPNFLPGLRVTHCQIVKITPQFESNTYLKQALRVEQRGNSEVVFGPMIFDKGDFFVLKFLLLHSESDKPQLEKFGIVAGGGEIELVSVPTPTDQRGFLARALSGSVVMQAFRALVYFLSVLVGGFAVGGIIAAITKFVTRRRRKRRIRIFERSLGAKPTKQQRLIVDMYRESGAAGIVRINELLSDSESVARAIRFQKKYGFSPVSATTQAVSASNFDIADEMFTVDLGRLMKEKMIEDANGTIAVDQGMITAVREFEEFLLHQDPEKVLNARGRRQREPYGTEAGPASESELQEAHVVDEGAVRPAEEAQREDNQ
jgi:CRP-like cAMP-binding protein